MAFTKEPTRKSHGVSLTQHLLNHNICQVHILTITKDLVSNIILEQKEIKRVAFEHCKKRILLIDHTKFTANGTYRLSALKEYDLIVTDTLPPYEIDVGNAKFIY